MISKIVNENFKSYAGVQTLGPFHKVWKLFNFVGKPDLKPRFKRFFVNENLFEMICVGQLLFNWKFNHYQLLWLAVIWFFSWYLTFLFLSQSFTSIVGPNGSGKSNVIDSMLFVFGFRANKIRSKKISVLIHDSENHKNLDFCTVGVHFQKIIDTGVSSLNLINESNPLKKTVSLSNPYQHLNLKIAYVDIIFRKLLEF